MSYCEKCGSPAEHNNSKNSDYYFRCTDKDCSCRKGGAIVRVKPVPEVANVLSMQR